MLQQAVHWELFLVTTANIVIAIINSCCTSSCSVMHKATRQQVIVIYHTVYTRWGARPLGSGIDIIGSSRVVVDIICGISSSIIISVSRWGTSGGLVG